MPNQQDFQSAQLRLARLPTTASGDFESAAIQSDTNAALEELGQGLRMFLTQMLAEAREFRVELEDMALTMENTQGS